MKMLEKWSKKSLVSKLSDIIFVAFVIAMLIPGPRKAIMAGVNRVKAMVIQPKISREPVSKLNDNDFIWSVSDLNGKVFHLSDFKGNVIFINFWATWCGPCLGEMPEIQKLYDNTKDDKKFKILVVSTESLETIKEFMRKKGYTFPVYKALTNIPQKLYSNSIPTSFLIDKQGNIVMRKVGATNWGGEKMKKEIEELLKK